MMKKITFILVAVFMTALCVNAQTFNNPKDAEGYHIVKWDCESDNFAAANDFEVDETFVFAIDVTGTPFEEWLKETPTAAGATRSLAINRWTNYGDVNGESNRLKQIKGNIFGATWNLAQLATTMNVESATGVDSVVYVYSEVFGFEFTATNPGANWYMEAVATGALFKTLPYTGTKTSEEFYNDEVEGGLFWGNNQLVKGYSLPCAVPNAIQPVSVDSPVVGHEYYNLQGMKLSKQPESGLYIDKALKADGTSVSTKILKQLK